MARLFLSLALFSCQNGTVSIFLTSALVEVETIPEPVAFPLIPERRLELVRVLDLKALPLPENVVTHS